MTKTQPLQSFYKDMPPLTRYNNMMISLKKYVCLLFLCLSSSLLAETNADRQIKLVNAARWQIGKTLEYNSAYQRISYPNGDIAMVEGVCTDVVVRSFRRGLSQDLQKLVHLDMKKHFSKYPKNWGLKRPDRNIDHRRVPNLRKYFSRRGWSVPVTKNKNDYKPGDIVVSKIGGKLPHIMIVSNKKASDGTPLVIHNIGWGTVEINHLFSFPIKAHFRIK